MLGAGLSAFDWSPDIAPGPQNFFIFHLSINKCFAIKFKLIDLLCKQLGLALNQLLNIFYLKFLE